MATSHTIDNFELGKPLGKGRFGQVWLAKDKRTDYIVAIKVLVKKQLETDKNIIKQLRREIEIQQTLKSEYILRMYGYFHDNVNIYLILEYAGNGELFDKLKNEGRFTEGVAANYIYQIAKAIETMHDLDIIHRDIKPENILIGCDGKLKLADLGWAVCNIDKKRTTFCGTPEYLSPEFTEKIPHDKAVDAWCLGILAYEFLVGKTPFEHPSRSNAHCYKNICKLEYSIPSFVSKEAESFIKRLLVKNAKERATIKEALKHPWLIKNAL
ncbi:Serine/Threonine protein kinase [Spraguea lophii 42_110]|uniref:Aurora kinase n=1 Tax=Spraguea lophii (strain 42_110) TaxID=1358809 RepID=S7W8Q6_SPRLO|nr:Serine/Threonine protein kinase [Spraguea lophii 42_110]